MFTYRTSKPVKLFEKHAIIQKHLENGTANFFTMDYTQIGTVYVAYYTGCSNSHYPSVQIYRNSDI